LKGVDLYDLTACPLPESKNEKPITAKSLIAHPFGDVTGMEDRQRLA